jgi:hypothetical protein
MMMRSFEEKADNIIISSLVLFLSGVDITEEEDAHGNCQQYLLVH